MPIEIKKAAVVGAGTMGAQIALHLANVGLPTLLMDVPPSELTDGEREQRLKPDDPQVRDRLTRTLLDRALKLSPPPLYLPESAGKWIEIGNIEDDLEKIRDADWIIEAVVEREDVKLDILSRIGVRARPDALVTTNTSGIPIARLAQALPPAHRKRFCGTHFFNPPRTMRLMELVAGPETEQRSLDEFTEFSEEVLGKSVVRCKDSPGFISNRIGYFALQHAIWLAVDGQYSVEEVDSITGPAMGRPKSATFRLADLIGLDLVRQIGANLLERLPEDDRKKYFGMPPVVIEMLKRGWLGEKSGQGFYRRVREQGVSRIESLDLKSMKYGPAGELKLESVRVALMQAEVGARIRAICAATDRAGQFAWSHLAAVLCHAADRLDEVAHDVEAVDRVMRWGFNWELGPFEIWDVLGVKQTAARLEKDGYPVPEKINSLLKAGKKSFYELRGVRRVHFNFGRGDYEAAEQEDGSIDLKMLHAAGRVVEANGGASVLDLGDGVACLEFHCKMNVLGPEQLEMTEKALEVVARGFEGLVIGNQGAHFSAGVNLKLFVQSIEKKDWDAIDRLLQRFQHVTGGLAQSQKPVVVACHGYSLGAGCELVQGSRQVVASAETYMGLPEVRVGLIPGAGGCKEMLVRALDRAKAARAEDVAPFIRGAWETVLGGKISTSGAEALRLDYLRKTETTVLTNPGRVLARAKGAVLEAARKGHRPRPMRQVPVLGESGFEVLKGVLLSLTASGTVAGYDEVVGEKLAYVFCGGNVPAGELSEQQLLDLEREAFLSLCGEPRTMERLQHMLKTGRPLKN